MKLYSELSDCIRGKVDEFLEYAVPTGIPMNEILSDSTSTRSIIRAAEGLLYRNHPGDTDKAIKIIQWVLKQQRRFILVTAIPICKQPQMRVLILRRLAGGIAAGNS